MKRFKPTSNGVRWKVSVDRGSLHKGSPYRRLTRARTRNPSGKNSQGKLVNRRIGGGVRRRIRIIDHSWDFDSAKVIRLEYDPNRSAWIALVHSSGGYRYVIAGHGWKAGDTVCKGDYNENARVQLSQVRQGDLGFCLSYDRDGKAAIARSAGTWIQVMNKEDDWVILRLPSGEVRRFKDNAWMTLGKASNVDHSKINLGKAGTAVRLNRRPVVRGLAQNCRDHPMGGKGQHKGKIPKNRWGKVAKGIRTRGRRRLSDKYIIRRRNAKK